MKKILYFLADMLNSRWFFALAVLIGTVIVAGLVFLWIGFWLDKEGWWSYLVAGLPILVYVYVNAYRKNP